MTHVVRVLRRAENDLGELARYVEVESPGMSAALVDGLLGAIESLSVTPLRGAVPADDAVRRAGYRYLVQGRYLIFYKVRGRTVRVHRVLHGRRAWASLLK